ncbi:MAG: hypothetical protein EPO68_03460 [Planctomycetota bacterium]|nr:MAG: hypothetical protein EPO68_03460 [Planctomycetota bacterium]
MSDCGSAFDVEGHNWVLLSSCVVTRNGAGIAFGPQQDASVLLHNSIVWDNAGQDFDPPDVEARYSDLSQALPGVGNLSVDPGFVAPASGDYHLRSDSALIDAGDPATVGGLDPDGDPRRTDGDWNADARADIGIDEFNRVRIAASGAAVLGGTVALTVTAPAGSAAVGFLSLHTADVSLGALGSVLIGALGPALFDPESVLVLGSGAAPWTFVAAVPNDPLLLGLQAHFQGFGKAATFAGASLSNRLTLVVH